MAGGYPAILHFKCFDVRSRATRRRSTRIALQARAIPHQREVGAFWATFSDIALHLGFGALVHAAALLGGSGIGAGRCEGEVGQGCFAHR